MLITPKWKNYQYYDMANSLSFNNDNNTNDINRPKQCQTIKFIFELFKIP